MLKNRPYYEATWIKTRGVFKNKIENLHCIQPSGPGIDFFYCYPIYVYQEGTSAEKEYYFDYGTRTFKGVSDDSVLEILSEIGVGGKIVYFAGNQMWWAGCESKELLEKGYVTHVK
jgi:hypothetical protein